MSFRVIGRLDIKGPNLVKGIHLEGLRVLGRPEQFARQFYADGIDEFLYNDVVASLYGRNSLLEIVERTSREIFIPLTVAGGLRSVDDIRSVLRAGADKVALNSAAVANPGLLTEAAQVFGSSTIVLSIEYNQSLEVLTDGGRETTGLNAFEWARQGAESGAGEILLTSIARDGTGQGFDLDFVGRVSAALSIPVIASGGAGQLAHVLAASECADAVALASLLHYNYLEEVEAASGEGVSEGNTEFLRSRRGRASIGPLRIPDLKRALAARGVPCRV